MIITTMMVRELRGKNKQPHFTNHPAKLRMLRETFKGFNELNLDIFFLGGDY